MKPRLYASNEFMFTSNGIGILNDTISCKVTWERNGEYELELTYPVDGIHYDSIADRSIIVAKPNPIWDEQPFRVYSFTKPINGIVTVRARHISYDLSSIIVEPFSASNAEMAMQMMKNKAVIASYFEYWTDKETETAMNSSVPATVRSLLGGSEGSILDTYGGEYEFDRYNVKLWSQLGEDRGVVIRYGKNLTDLKQERDCANVFTGVYPYWLGMDGTLVTHPDRIITAEGNFGYTKIKILDLSSEWDECPTTEQLQARAQKYIIENDIGKPNVNLSLSFVQLEQSEEYKGKALLESVYPCDTVTVEFPKLGVSASSKCIKTVYNCLLDRYENIELGNTKTRFVDTILEQKKEIEKKPGNSQVKYAVNALSSTILGAYGGAVRLLDTNGDGMPDTLYIADDPDPALAQKVWRFNYEGWGASENGYNGPFVLGASLTEGLIADFITAGTLNADLIKAGVIKSKDGTSFLLDVDTGTLVLGGYPTEKEVSALIEKSEEGIGVTIKDITNNVTALQQTAGQVSVEAKSEQGTLTTVISNDGTWKSEYVDANGNILSGIYFDFLKESFVFKGSGEFSGKLNIGNGNFVVDEAGNLISKGAAQIVGGKFYALNEDGTIGDCFEITADGLTMYRKRDFFPVFSIEKNEADDGNVYPRITLNSTASDEIEANFPGIIQRFADGLWIGNAFVSRDDDNNLATVDIDSLARSNGIFISLVDGQTYAVVGNNRRNFYTGDTIARFG